ncbi:hypothetical protein BJ322DRAFT_163498 [Thelephora terrestris]|uniref:Uncharacterized protein n=1 Tax=Thelephora terrestris TaxID=56493 RepID=A0A9P6L471_9AGAM|nr:hypothetical protein BJ322DRAFT_163498 [Thelephora terrestris]
MSFRYKIPAGYHHVLLGFNREIDFIVEDHVDDNESRLRCKYLMQVLDSFVEELKERTIRDISKMAKNLFFPTFIYSRHGFYKYVLLSFFHLFLRKSFEKGTEKYFSLTLMDPAKFRSKVLNPIIQRQLRGVADNDSDEVKKAVGTKLEDAVNFYLARDPLNPQDCPALFRNLLYITPVRLSFACYDSQCSKAVYEKSRLNTKFLRHSCVQHDTSDQILLLPFEVEVIEHEGLGGLYRGLIKASPRPTGEHTSSVQATPMPIYYVDIVAFDQAAANPSNSLVTLEVYRSEIRSIMLQEQNDAQAILARMNDRRLIWRGLIARWNALIISQGGQALADSSDDEEPMGV